jgi:DNA-binding beta-propeller fold protein YncE
LQNGLNGIAVDALNNEIFSANYYDKTITVYSRTDSGNVAPARTISGAATSLIGPQSIAVDTVNNEIFIMNYQPSPSPIGQPIISITVFSRTANGNVRPLRAISGNLTGLHGADGIAIDSVRNEIYVANVDSKAVFSRTADGNVSPLRTISGGATGLNFASGLALEAR